MQIVDGVRLYSASDLCGFLECEHLTALDMAHLVSPMERAPETEENRLIQEKGLEHEAAYLEWLKLEYPVVVDIAASGARSISRKVELTREAMQAGADIIFQATLQEGVFVGHADFFRKVSLPSALGDHSYEVIDTKLAKTPKAKFIVQLALYSQMLVPLQGVRPHFMHVVLGDAARSERPFRVADYSDYLDQVLRRFDAFVSAPQPSTTYPDPCDHCRFCGWRDRCAIQREQDDHLSAVANISKSQIKKLQSAGVQTLEQLANSAERNSVPKLNAESLNKLRHQARLQHRGRHSDTPIYELLPPQAGLRGFGRMPEPAEGDLFFDMEGDPLEEGGLEYLFGLYIDESGSQRFLPFWGHSRKEEKQAFEAFIDFLMTHLARYPQAYIYHYASYEETAIKRLMSQHGTREVQVDWLLRNGKLIDLYKVVREAVRVSEPSYSIKYIEHFYMEKRVGEVTSAGASIVFYERWKQSGDPELLETIERYNEDDVRSTYLLRNWLLAIKPAGGGFDATIVRAVEAENDPLAVGASEQEIRLENYRQRLVGQFPEDGSQWDNEAAVRGLVFQLLDFHRRTEKPVWWDMFKRQDMASEELLEDIESLAGLARTAQPPVPEKRSFLYQYRFPEQETKLHAGSQGRVVETLNTITLHELDMENLLATFKATVESQPPVAFDMGPGGPVNTKVIREALFRYADAVLAGGERFKAVDDFLFRRSPKVIGLEAGTALLATSLAPLDAIKQVVRNLDHSVLFIQGPPGAGKTYTGSHLILDLLQAGKRVGITSNSHHAINNLLAAVETCADAAGFSFVGLKKSTRGAEETRFSGRCITSQEDNAKLLTAWNSGARLVAGTAWLFADEAFSEALDYLFIDEAGQVSVANLVAMGMSARNLVLMGDQMQLSQPIKGVHPGRSGDSILDYLLDGVATIPADRGVFLAQTWRMHPEVCSFISEAVYDGQLASAPGTERQLLILDGERPKIPDCGLYFWPVEHDANSQSSEEEAAVVSDLYGYFLGQTYVDKDGERHRVEVDNILVVAPYNLHVQLLKRELPAGARVGTVDKFQGQEAEIVIVSMATSNEDYLPRDIAFLYSKNRLNVAISRAKTLACVIASPALTAIRCKTPEEMSLVNTLCKVVKSGSMTRDSQHG
ncbi:TM0106 family RecB-like putative nuclease [Pseudomonas sp. GM60]|uniref:TM0106 family RecB-like putative nuclease n=1 Tax=Pseudomonas sp. GM60 TaxID=1144334 RepID=UPI0002706E7B|nr:TM0106 family RecB-like putative nuclease [Pseudomonas sp. GM60]EJM79599.1 RecB family nuclease, putative, TM0106 family [Pseudomonas sp. GM60]